MKYDPLELMKLNITEADIQKQRDYILNALTIERPPGIDKFVMIYEKFWLPFIIDMFDDYKTFIEPCRGGVRITINL